MSDQLYRDTAHLLRRAGFGAAPETIQSAARQGLAQTTALLLHPDAQPDPINDDQIITRLTDLLPESKAVMNGEIPVQAVKMWWTMRMIASPRPLVEKMTLFWHGHFTSKLGGNQGLEMLRQNQLFRKNALGNFRTLTQTISRDPAMLKYLNGNQNFKAHPNENYGRELMELYTCGIGNYTEDDVKSAARAFSGWNLRQGDFYFNPRQHDDTPKTFLGKTSDWNGDDIVDMLVAHPATARRICTKIFTYLAYPNPEPSVLDALVKTYYSSGYEIGAIVSQILRSTAFYSERARFAVIKCPAQYVVGTVKMLGMEQAVLLRPEDITPANDMAAAPMGGMTNGTTDVQRAKGRRLGALAGLTVAMRNMGQDLFNPPSVKGWDGGEDWINSATLMARLNFANTISLSPEAFNGQFAHAAAFVQQQGLDAGGWVDYLAQTLGPLELSPASRQTLIGYVNGTDDSAALASQVPNNDAPPATALPGGGFGQRRRFRTALQRPGVQRYLAMAQSGQEGRLRGLIPLMMATPEYQVC